MGDKILSKTIQNINEQAITLGGSKQESQSEIIFDLDCNKSFFGRRPLICSMEFAFRNCDFFSREFSLARSLVKESSTAYALTRLAAMTMSPEVTANDRLMLVEQFISASGSFKEIETKIYYMKELAAVLMNAGFEKEADDLFTKAIGHVKSLDAAYKRSIAYTEVASKMMDAKIKDKAIKTFKMARKEWEHINVPREASMAGRALQFALKKYGVEAEVFKKD